MRVGKDVEIEEDLLELVRRGRRSDAGGRLGRRRRSVRGTAAVDRVLETLDRAGVVRPGAPRRRQGDVGQLHSCEDLPVDGLNQRLRGFCRGLQVPGLGVQQLGDRRILPVPQPVPVVDTVVPVGGQDDRAAFCYRRCGRTRHDDEHRTST